MTWIVVGASSGLGRALSERLAVERKPLLLVSSDIRDLLPLASDLQIRFGIEVRCHSHNAEDHVGLAEGLFNSLRSGEPIDGILFPIGYIDRMDHGDLAPPNIERLIKINFLSVVSVMSLLLPMMLERKKGVIIGFGSIAGVRGRMNNVVYSASKRALQSYFESLRHRYERYGLLIQFYVLGYLDTNLAFGQKLLLPKADPARAAKSVVSNLRKRGGTRYLPRFWRPIGMIVQILPWLIFKRMNF